MKMINKSMKSCTKKRKKSMNSWRNLKKRRLNMRMK